MHLVARCAPPHPRSWAQFINPLLPALTASSLLTNASLDRCSLTQFQGREVTDHLLNGTRSMKCHHDQASEVDRPPAQVLFLFSRKHQADEVILCHHYIHNRMRKMQTHSPSTGQTPLWVIQVFFLLARIDIFV